MNSSPRILILVLNYQTPALTLRCAESLCPILGQYSNAQVVIIDNGSGKSSVNSLSTQVRDSASLAPFQDRVQLRCLPKNVGYAAGNNAAIRSALDSTNPPAFIWLLNSDTIVQSDALAALVDAMESDQHIGIVGSRLENTDGSPQRSAFRFPTIAGEWEANLHWQIATRLFSQAVLAPPPAAQNTRVDWVAGASMLIRRQVFEEVGLFDGNFFLYFEEVDLSSRAVGAGWETWYIPTSRVTHFVGASSNIASSRRMDIRMPKYWFASRRRYFEKHRGALYATCADAAWLVGFGIWRVRRWLQRKPDLDPPRYWLDFLAYSINPQGTARE